MAVAVVAVVLVVEAVVVAAAAVVVEVVIHYLVHQLMEESLPVMTVLSVDSAHTAQRHHPLHVSISCLQ